MIRKSYTRAAAIGGLTAAIALLSGLPAASADELSDLKSNQMLLNRRIEQLETQSRMAPGAPGAAGAAVGAGSFPRSFLIPGTDTSLRVGGAIIVDSQYYMTGAPGINGSNGVGTGLGTVAVTGTLTGVTLDPHGKVVKGVVQATSPQHSRGRTWAISARRSQFNCETRTPTAWGEAKTLVELDFAGQNGIANNLNQISNSWVPRLRYAYGTLGGLLVGQANSNFRDADSEPELLDFGGTEGYTGLARLPQARYTITGPYGTALAISAENPTTDIFTPFGYAETDTISLVTAGCPAGTQPNANTSTAQAACTNLNQVNNPSYNKMPDFVAAVVATQPWGHMNVRAVFRDLTIKDGKFVDKSYLGYGVGFSGDVKPGWLGWVKDDITFGFAFGDGSGRYITDGAAGLATNYTTAPGSAAAASNIIAKTITEFGGHVGYQHWWLDNLRSTINFGITHSDVNSILIGPQTTPTGLTFAGNPVAAGSDAVANKELISGHVNLIWSPIAFVDAGIEYIYGHRQTTANVKGDLHAIEGLFRVKF